jgi:hypothetical protein
VLALPPRRWRPTRTGKPASVAENGSGRISVITVSGDKASVAVIKEGLNTPTAVEPAGDTIWIAERRTGKAVSIPMPK